jgi:SHS2 domain-containing protein
MTYKFLRHTADVKFNASGKTLNKCFSDSAIAMFKAMYPDDIESKIKKTIKVKGKDLESLLYNFLEELLVLLDSKDFFVSKVDVKVNEDDFSLVAKVLGDKTSNYSISLQVKAVTYNEMSVRKTKGLWRSVVVLDV